MSAVATDFQKIITQARERRRNEALADKIFGRNRHQSTPSKIRVTPRGSLTGRVGVKKQRAPSVTSSPRTRLPVGNINGEWTHDLHESVNRVGPSSNGSLASRIRQSDSKIDLKRSRYKPSSKLPSVTKQKEPDQTSSQAHAMGMSIRGLAGPFVVMGQNFAPGTTAADIESAMEPVGGKMLSCRIVTTRPFIVAEMSFALREGGERVIETFNDKMADGRIIKVYPKPGG